jgi:hypothetical protein
MAQKPDRKGDGAEFVREIVSDPNYVPDVMLLYGYVGDSSEAEHERLYLRTDLSNYVEVPKSAILHRLAAPKEQDPHGGVTLWVKKDANLIYKLAPGAQALAHFFAGQIQAGAAPAGAPQAAQFPPTLLCPTRLPCVSFGPQCPPAAAAAPQGPVALGNSQFIRSCIQCGPSFFWNCTFAAAGGAQAGIGPSFQHQTCGEPCLGSLPQCTVRVDPQAGIGPSYLGNTCFDARCPRTFPDIDCTLRVDPRAGIGPSFNGVTCGDPCVPSRPHINCTLRVDPRAGFNATFFAQTCIYLHCTATGECTV